MENWIILYLKFVQTSDRYLFSQAWNISVEYKITAYMFTYICASIPWEEYSLKIANTYIAQNYYIMQN